MNSNSFMRVQVQKKYFFEFEFGKMIEFFRVCSPMNSRHKNDEIKIGWWVKIVLMSNSNANFSNKQEYATTQAIKDNYLT